MWLDGKKAFQAQEKFRAKVLTCAWIILRIRKRLVWLVGTEQEGEI